MTTRIYLDQLALRIEFLLNDSNILLDPPSRETLEFAEKEVAWVKEVFTTRMDWIGLHSLKTEVVEASSSLLMMNLNRAPEFDSVNLDEVRQEIQRLVARMKEMEEEYADLLYNPLPPEDEEDGIDVSESIGLEPMMVGLSDQYKEVKEKLLTAPSYRSMLLTLDGMPGIGKTTLAMEVFADPDIVKYFDVRVWVPVGRRCSLEEIPRRILARVNPDCLNQIDAERDVAHHLRKIIQGKKSLIVLDNVWGRHFEKNLRAFNLLSRQTEWSCILCTTRLKQSNLDNITMRLMNEEESWDLLREKVFGEDSCTTQFEKAGKKIAKNCEGLPLTIVTIADHLSKVKEIEYWDEVAAKKKHKLFKDVYDQISKVLVPSYNYLPRLLQMCFLYMGVFPQNYEIPKSKIVIMWNVDRFFEWKESLDAINCLEELVRNNLVMIYQKASRSFGRSNVKTCGLHSSFWHLSTTEARKTKFCHVLCSRDDGLNEDIIGQQRLSFHNNILCTIKDVYQFVEDNCASTVHSLFYYGPYNPFQVPICFGLRLVSELDILTIRFYAFPMDILKLVELRYLALTCDGELPTSISQLSNLQFLIVGRHYAVTKPSRDRYLPVEIWNMRELQHIQTIGSELPHPGGGLLENLSTLLNVSASSCTKKILKAVPRLEKLGIRIELGPNDEGIPLRCFDHISHLKRLSSLTCVVVNPKIMFQGDHQFMRLLLNLKKFRVSKLGRKEISGGAYHRKKLRYLTNGVANPKILAPLSSNPAFPSSLEKLSLSGLGLPWKNMRKIAELPRLRVLKIRNYAFRGPYWRVKNEEFPSLQSLVIEDSDLVEWSIGSGSFNFLRSLTLKHCYRYERTVVETPIYVRNIALVDCNPLGVQQMKVSFHYSVIECHSSFTDEEKGNL